MTTDKTGNKAKTRKIIQEMLGAGVDINDIYEVLDEFRGVRVCRIKVRKNEP